MTILDKLLRAGEGRILKQLKAIARAVNELEDQFVDLSDDELKSMTDEFKKRLDDGESLDDILPEAFATVREAAKRVLGQRHYDVQIMGGAALHLGNIAEMKTGEGKTLVSTLPVYLNGLSGKGVHVVTTNDYLAQRDAEWMGEVHRFLGLTVGVVLPRQGSAKHREAYACDITYGTNNEFCFDYLRDNMAWSKNDLVQRGHNFAVVDEADSILIDEARTPIIISGPAESSSRWYKEFARLIPRMKSIDTTNLHTKPPAEQTELRQTIDVDYHYEFDLKKRTVAITAKGVQFVEDQIGIENLYDPSNTPLVGYLNNAIKAQELFKSDRDYIVSNDGEVLIVDEFTGRILHGRRYNEGIHQAIEAKEGVEIKQENQTLASTTLQNYFRLYDTLSGMTGTAMTEAGEFSKVYGMEVVPIPTNKDMIRADQADVIFKSETAKYEAVVDDIVERHENGQPVLVGTVSVDKSELLSDMLRKRGITHAVLNAKNHSKEAEIVAQAGRKGAVTVATNMAGRGTDIVLGGNPEFLAAAELRRRGVDEANEETYSKEWEAALARWEEECGAEEDEVIDAGGLYVLGTERHESRRIDNQLRGRSGRQGDPGESRFYLSLQDDLMRRFNSAAVEALMNRLRVPDDVPIESKLVTRQIRSAQTQIEGQNAEMRKNVLKYDEVMNQQRTVVYDERRKVLDGEDVSEQIRNMLDDVVTAYVDGATADGYAEDWDLDELWKALKLLYPVGITVDEVLDEVDGRDNLEPDKLVELLQGDAHRAYDAREEELGAEVTRGLERKVLLQVIDRKWREHLYEMDYLKEGISLRAYAQRDPVVEYRREGYEMFSVMLDGIKEDTVRYLFNLDVQVKEGEDADGSESVAATVGAKPAPAPTLSSGVTITAKGLEAPQQPQRLQYLAPAIDGEAGAGGAVVTAEDEAPQALRRAKNAGKGKSSRKAVAPAAKSISPDGVKSRKPGPKSASATGGRKPSPGQRVGTGGPSRNGPCPCGSGKKYKRCHGAPGAND